MTDDNARVSRTRRWLVAAFAVTAVAGAAATEVPTTGTPDQPVSAGGVAERTEPARSPSPSCHPLPEGAEEAVAGARPGDGQFEAVAADSLPTRAAVANDRDVAHRGPPRGGTLRCEILSR